MPNRPHVNLLGTIQFRHALSEAQDLLRSERYGYNTSIPQAKPLSPGEVLGCTSPALARNDDIENNNKNESKESIVLFVADGRFHLEATMIANPHIPHFYRYDPYSKTLTEESYQHQKMKSIRYKAIQEASNSSVNIFGIILGTLGRQGEQSLCRINGSAIHSDVFLFSLHFCSFVSGNPALLTRIQERIKKCNKRSFVMLASEITPAKLALFDDKVDAWVQIACPRLSVDWGHALSASKPVLNPYELFVCLGATEWREKEPYPMDYYAQAGGPWSNYHAKNNERQLQV
jgi:2-(3-amino-3-carboxypropyl)histidine synthase